MKKNLANTLIVFTLLTSSGVLAQTVEVQNKTQGPIEVYVRGRNTGKAAQAATLSAGGVELLNVQRDKLGLVGESRYDLAARNTLTTNMPVNGAAVTVNGAVVPVTAVVPMDVSFPVGSCHNLSADEDGLVVIQQGVAGELTTTCTARKVR